jgi:hypothetical protein
MPPATTSSHCVHTFTKRVCISVGRILSFDSVINPDPVLDMKYLSCWIRVVVGRILSFDPVINPDPVLGMKYLTCRIRVVVGRILSFYSVINPDPVLGMKYLACLIRVFSVPKQKPNQLSIRNSNTRKYPIGPVILWQKNEP